MKEPHAITRARERYGVELGMDTLKGLEDAVRDDEALLVGTDYKTSSPIYLVKHEETIMRCVVSRLNGRIITFLPPMAEVKKVFKPVDKQHKSGKYYTKKDKRKIRRR